MNDHNSLPRHLVEFLGVEKDKIEMHMAEYQKKPIVNDIIKLATRTLVEVINPFYNSKDMDVRIDNVARFIGEPLKNANFYSRNDLPITFGIFLSEKGLIASYNDGGIYFKNQNVKRCWENRERYRERNGTKIPGVGKGLGTAHIYNHADVIYVDSSEGTLYIGLRINKIIWE